MADYREFEQMLIKELVKDEELLWRGQPNPREFFTKFDIFFIPFSLLWVGFAFFFLVKSISLPYMSFVFVLGSIPFVIVGLYITIGRFFYKVYKKKRTMYAITCKRIFEIFSGSRPKTKYLYFRNISGVNHIKGNNENGSITFRTSENTSELYANTGMDFLNRQLSYKPAFYDIDNSDIPENHSFKRIY